MIARPSRGMGTSSLGRVAQGSPEAGLEQGSLGRVVPGPALPLLGTPPGYTTHSGYTRQGTAGYSRYSRVSVCGREGDEGRSVGVYAPTVPE